jgi:hypothetical protein
VAFATRAVYDRNGCEIVAGASVLIAAGTEIGGTFSGPTKVAKADYVVKVRRVSPGWPAISPHRDDQGRADEVVWSGSGGYWHSTEAEHVELTS